MTRVTGPCFALDARKTLGGTLTYSFWRGINYVRARIVPHNPKSDKQTAVRGVLTDGVSKWRFGMITGSDKNWWNTYAKGLGESGFNRYMRKYIEDNYDSDAGEAVAAQVLPSPQ
ncbi:MAG TPA: hypothetical protein VMY36_00105 [Patescibacteria group bacterium]|nr:hypothetical protein [Patescibacteria group bacterium]